MNNHPLLDVRNLYTYFYTHDGIVKAVDGVSYNVKAGETIALVGESGCGKTVSALSVLRLIQDPPGKIVSGEIIFDGINLLSLSRGQINEIRGARIAMIFQEPLTALNPVLTVGSQIAGALERHRNMKGQVAIEEAVRLLTLVGIPQPDRRVKEYPHQFSGGMRQRAMIALAISCQPQLIIADEPTTVVDVTIQAQLLELIKGLTRELNTALVLITHNLGIVARYAHRVYVMYAGHIVEHGTSAEIYRNPLHPYTRGLLASVPRLDEPRKARLQSIEGQPPDLINPPKGCAFAPRCQLHVDVCLKEPPEITEISPGHFVACWLVNAQGKTTNEGK